MDVERMHKVEFLREQLGDRLVDIWNEHRHAIDSEANCDSYGRRLLTRDKAEFDSFCVSALEELAEEYRVQ